MDENEELIYENTAVSHEKSRLRITRRDVQHGGAYRYRVNDKIVDRDVYMSVVETMKLETMTIIGLTYLERP